MTAGPVRRDIADRADIAGLVTAFYRRAFADDTLGPIFVDIAQMDLPAHLPVMCDFWESVLLRSNCQYLWMKIFRLLRVGGVARVVRRACRP